MIFLFLLPRLFPYFFPQNEAAFSELEMVYQAAAVQDSAGRYTQNSREDFEFRRPAGEYNAKALKPFAFDPNTVSATELQQMGLPEKTIQTWMKFRSSGFHFRSPNDLKRIYGLRPQDADLLMGYAEIRDNRRFAETAVQHQPGEARRTTAFENNRSRPAVQKVDVNSADTSAWKSLPGIGPVYAGRIVNFRNKLGGFKSIDQIAETRGLPDSVFQKILPHLSLNTGVYHKMHLNKITLEELRSHPYIQWSEANAIINYRQQHGDFNHINELLKIHLISAGWLARVEPYLTIE